MAPEALFDRVYTHQSDVYVAPRPGRGWGGEPGGAQATPGQGPGSCGAEPATISSPLHPTGVCPGASPCTGDRGRQGELTVPRPRRPQLVLRCPALGDLHAGGLAVPRHPRGGALQAAEGRPPHGQAGQLHARSVSARTRLSPRDPAGPPLSPAPGQGEGRPRGCSQGRGTGTVCGRRAGPT